MPISLKWIIEHVNCSLSAQGIEREEFMVDYVIDVSHYRRVKRVARGPQNGSVKGKRLAAKKNGHEAATVFQRAHSAAVAAAGGDQAWSRLPIRDQSQRIYREMRRIDAERQNQDDSSRPGNRL